MTTDELNAALTLTRKIDRLQARLNDLRQTGGLGSIGTDTPVQGGTGSIGAGQLAAELAQEIDSLKSQRAIEQEIIRRYISKLNLDEVERKVANLRYIRCLPWKEIEISIGYARAQTYRICDRVKLILNDTQ